MVQTAPCSWPVDYSAYGVSDDAPLPEPLASMPASGVATIELIATSLLWRWTGKQFGACPVTIRPLRSDCIGDETSSFWGYGPFGSGPYGMYGGFPWRPVIIDGLWWNMQNGPGSQPRGSCDIVAQIPLTGPVDSIVSVVIDGEPLDQSAYRVDMGNLLTRQDGQQWPRCNNWGTPEDADGVWTVTYNQGVPVPLDGQAAAGALAVELAKAFRRDKDCALPQRVQSISRAGVTLAVIDTFDNVVQGVTGIFTIDYWVASIMNAPRISRVYSPDVRRARRTTWSPS